MILGLRGKLHTAPPRIRFCLALRHVDGGVEGQRSFCPHTSNAPLAAHTCPEKRSGGSLTDEVEVLAVADLTLCDCECPGCFGAGFELVIPSEAFAARE